MHQRFMMPSLVLLLLLATLTPLGSEAPHFDFQIGLADVLVNLALFFPLGLVAKQQGWNRTPALLLALGLSAGAELLQGLLVAGRHGSPLDVLANVAGCLAGLLWWRLPPLLLALPAIAWLASAILLAPAAPRTQTWWGQWAHSFAGTTPFPGTVTAVRFMERPAPDGRLSATTDLIAAARREGLRIQVWLRSSGPTPGRSHIAGVSDGEGHVVLALEQIGSDLLVSWWSRGAAFGLRTPSVLFPGLLAAPEGTPFELQVLVRSNGVTVTGSRAGTSLTRRGALTPLQGWQSLVEAPEPTARAQRLFTALWGAGGLGYLLLLVARIRGSPFSWRSRRPLREA